MTRSNSPPHPSLSLPKAITAVGKIFNADRRNPVDRDVAARHVGYTGKSGASDKALAALAHFGLTEKVGKGSIRVSQLAMDILHPDPSDPHSKDRALLEAGMKPQLYKELRAQFPDQVSEQTLRSYLLRIGFNDTSLPAAVNSYFDTLRFLEQSKVFESGGIGEPEGEESDPKEDFREPQPMQPATVIDPPRAAPPAAKPPAPSGLNQINMDIRGDQVLVSGLLDMKGLSLLEKKIQALKVLLTVYTDPNDTGDEDDYDL